MVLLVFIVAPVVCGGLSVMYLFCFAVLSILSSFKIVSLGKRELLMTFCLLLLLLWESVIVLCFVVRYFVSILVVQPS